MEKTVHLLERGIIQTETDGLGRPPRDEDNEKEGRGA